MASANCPRLVASTAAVVSTRVSPWMFPPTICAAPTSLTTAPKPAKPAASSGNRASASSAAVARVRVAPSARICSRKPGSTCWSAAAVSAATIGVAITAWAMTMAVGVYSNPNAPSGPLRHSSTVTNSPTTTGGRPIPVFAAASITRRPANRPRARAVPKGTPSSSATAVAVSDTRSVSAVIDQVSSSPVSSSRTASSSPSSSTSTAYRPSSLALVGRVRGAAELASSRPTRAQAPRLASSLPASGVNSGCPNLACPNWPICCCAGGPVIQSANARAPSGCTRSPALVVISIT